MAGGANVDGKQISMEELAQDVYGNAENVAYDAFVEKFKPKRTTDDCFTPPNIYEAVRDFVFDEYGLPEGIRVIRPFYPGGDYLAEDYSGNCIVIDNPPFSILSKIVKFYMAHGVRFFLFAPALTLFSTGYMDGVNVVVCGVTITYDNGAKVSTSFVTNLGDDKIYCCARLCKKIKEIDLQNVRMKSNKPPIYDYPHNVVNAARLQYISNHGVDFRVKAQDTHFIRSIDAQKKHGKTLFGGGFLLSEKAAAEKAAAEKANAIIWEMSECEKKIIANLGK